MHRDAGYQALVAEFTRVSIEHREIELRSNTAMVLEERPDSKAAAHLLFRGMYDQPRELLEAATPSFLPPMAPGLPRNRLGLARWMVDRANPLFARVTVNRFWQEFFGAGILESADDFGAQAQPPSHPELLDWLAVEFRESGWDVKKLITLIVTSAAYRQSAAISPDKLSERSAEHPAGARTAVPPRRRSRARFRAGGQRSARDEARRPSGQAVPPCGSLGRHVDGVQQHEELQTGYRRVAVPSQHLHAVEAPGSARVDGHLRRPDARSVRRPARADQHADAGAGDDERSAVRRSGARARAESACRRRRRCEWRDRFHDRFACWRAPSRLQSATIVLGAYQDFAAHYRANAPAAAQLLAVGESPADSEPSASQSSRR